ncbi:MAG: ornithine carbamoyltransferase [Phototrophicales bacterium]|nr:MAG: ornithine carbamoyltransferase [Phototrophicales bacterium]
MRHFIDLTDWSGQELRDILTLAQHLKAEWSNGGNAPLLRGKTLAMIFQKPSLRTRVSFDVGMQHLGGSAIMLGPDEIGLGKRESVADTARTLSGYVQAIMARVFAHKDVLSLADNASVPVINGLSDTHHPCQAMADMLTILEHFGQIEGVQIAYVGDSNNVAVSLAQAAAYFGGHVRIASPPGYMLSEELLSQIDETARQHGGSLAAFYDPVEAVRGAQVIYTDTWVSMGQEAETAIRLPIFQPYQVNRNLVRHADSGAIIMHCLPAHRGQEITDDVADSAQSVIFRQAENRLHAQKAILVTLLQ